MSTRRSTPASARRTRTVRRRISPARPRLRADGAGITSAPKGDAGTAIVGTFVGGTIFLIFLLFATQFLVRLYATSVLTAAALDAADEVATSPASGAVAGGNLTTEVSVAEAAARRRLGSFGASHTTFIWREVDAQRVVLEVRAESPGFVPLPASYRRIDRTVSVRTEEFR